MSSISEHKCCRNYNLGSLVTYEGIGLHYAKEIIDDLFMPLRKMKDDIRQKFMIDVSIRQCGRAKKLALFNHEGGLIEHYEKLYQYRQALLDSNLGCTCRLDVDEYANGYVYFKRMYICFKGVYVKDVIPLTDAYESDPEALEAAPQSPNQAPLSPAHAPVYPEYLAPSDDDLEPAEAQPLPASVSPTALLPDYSADSEPFEEDPEEEPSKEEEEELSASADSPPAGLYIELPSERFEIRESSADAAARKPMSTLARGTDYGFVTALEEVNERVTDLATSYRQDSHEFYVRHKDAQDDRVAEVRVLQQQWRDNADMLTRHIQRDRARRMLEIPSDVSLSVDSKNYTTSLSYDIMEVNNTFRISNNLPIWEVMAISVISVSSDSSKESVGTSTR
ncbi:hypothetical protein Tco_1407573 [Tanacetum coccineum]